MGFNESLSFSQYFYFIFCVYLPYMFTVCKYEATTVILIFRRPARVCICSTFPVRPVDIKTQVHILQHPKEVKSNIWSWKNIWLFIFIIIVFVVVIMCVSGHFCSTRLFSNSAFFVLCSKKIWSYETRCHTVQWDQRRYIHF